MWSEGTLLFHRSKSLECSIKKAAVMRIFEQLIRRLDLQDSTCREERHSTSLSIIEFESKPLIYYIINKINGRLSICIRSTFRTHRRLDFFRSIKHWSGHFPSPRWKRVGDLSRSSSGWQSNDDFSPAWKERSVAGCPIFYISFSLTNESCRRITPPCQVQVGR